MTVRKKNRIPAKRRNKYGNTKVLIDGITFQSKKEGNRYIDLKLLQDCGEISELVLQKPYKLIINDFLICTYKADFVYKEKDGTTVVEDAKGMKTQVYKLKKKLMKAIHNIDIVEV